MKTLLMVWVMVWSGAAVAEDGFDQTPLAQALLSDGDSSARFAQVLEQQPTAAGKQQRDEEEAEEYRSPEQPYQQDDYRY